MRITPGFYKFVWQLIGAGLYFTAISYRLQEAEVEYIVNDCGARVFITSKDRQNVVDKLIGKMPNVIPPTCWMALLPGFESWGRDHRPARPVTPISDESTGASMLYSSGTTGRPKGVLKPLPEGEYGVEDGPNLFALLVRRER